MGTCGLKPVAVDLEDWVRSGEGWNAVTYYHKTDDSLLLKLNSESMPYEQTLAEFELTKAVHGLGVHSPDAVSFVTDGKRYGIITERFLGKRSFAKILFEQPEMLDELARDMADAARSLHSLPCDTAVFESIPERLRKEINSCRWIKGKLKTLMNGYADRMESATACLHGDMHPGNILRTSKGDFWIDMGRFGYGDPDLDYASQYLLANLAPASIVKTILHIDQPTYRRFVERFGEYYYGDDFHKPETQERLRQALCLLLGHAMAKSPSAVVIYGSYVKGHTGVTRFCLKMINAMISFADAVRGVLHGKPEKVSGAAGCSGNNGFPTVSGIVNALGNVYSITRETPCWHASRLSDHYGCDIFLKREDRQKVRSYKIRGAYNKISSLSRDELAKGVVCASAGNHAQGVAFSCSKLGVKGYVFMPETTPAQKIDSVKYFGKDNVEIRLSGRTFDEAAAAAMAFSTAHGATFIHPFDDSVIIEGQGTVAYEILEAMKKKNVVLDYLFVPIGGGGLASGAGLYIKHASPSTKVIGVEPSGAASMKAAFAEGHPVTLNDIDTFVDGAAVARVGEITYKVCREVLDDIILVPEGEVCKAMLALYNTKGMVLEPAGALSVAALESCREMIKGKNVCCILSGSNNDIVRIDEIRRRALEYDQSSRL